MKTIVAERVCLRREEINRMIRRSDQQYTAIPIGPKGY